MKKGLIIIGVFFTFVLLGIGGMWFTLSSNMKEIRAITINEMDVANMADQTIRGSYYYEDEIGATVEVQIKDGRITEIIYIEHIAGKGTIAEVIKNDIILEQSLLVDNIAGATTSSHVIKLAIQNALEEAK
jgi:uncharacterized protein with FMN-binding domain